LFVYRFIREPSVADIQRGFAGALVLMVVILALFVVARIVGRDRTATKKRRPSVWARLAGVPETVSPARGDRPQTATSRTVPPALGEGLS
jgi:phosphate transport system permease protein